MFWKIWNISFEMGYGQGVKLRYCPIGDHLNFWVSPKNAKNRVFCFLASYLRFWYWTHISRVPPVPNGYPNPTRYPVFFSIPDPTRFSFENHRVAGNPKYRVLPDISGKPEVSGITRYFGYSQTWLGISGITPRQSWVLVGGKLFVIFCNVRKKP